MPYSFEYYPENGENVFQEGKKLKLSEENHDFLVGDIAKKWDEWDSARSSNLHAISAVEKAVYPSRKPNTAGASLNMPEIYEIRETYKAHLWKSWFTSLDTMFDVQGKTKLDQENAPKQKAALVDAFRSTDLVLKLEKGLDNWINKGEFIAFVSWSTKVKQRRKRNKQQAKNISLVFPTSNTGQKINTFGDATGENNVYSLFNREEIKREGKGYDTGKFEAKASADGSPDGTGIEQSSIPISNFASQKQFVLKNEVVYDGPDVTIVPPESFVFNPAKKESFETCEKIYRSWATVDELQTNLLYKNLEGLEEVCSDKTSQNSDCKACKSNQIEILEFWGDVKLSDGTILKNYVVTLAGRKNIIRFEENPFILNPFIFASFLEDPETKRGYSPLYVALSLNQASETIMNLQLDALKLIINKPYLAPKGALSGKINVKEGSIIEYDPALMPREPVPLDFKDAIVGWDFLKFFESKIESTTGIFKYMSGNPSVSNQRTATEAAGLMTGQNIRLAKEIDTLNYRVKIPLIQKISDMLANFSFDIKEIKISRQNGDVDFTQIDETVRQGNYDYLIGDSNAAFERKTRLKESLGFLYEAAKLPEVAPRIRWVEVMKWAFGQMSSVDPNMFLKDDTGI